MQSRPFSYLFSISYFGARYKGWAPQPNQPTVQRRIERVLRHVLGHEDFSLIGASRTDSGVSCRDGYFQLFLREKVSLTGLLPELNTHLPDDIRVSQVQEVEADFNLIQSVSQKTYRYYFSNQAVFNPSISAFAVHVSEPLQVDLMKKAVESFVGDHNFKAFCKTSPNKSEYNRDVISAEIFTTNEFQGIIFPSELLFFEVTGTGFLHHQVRKMMWSIWEVGKGVWNLNEIRDRLDNPENSWDQIPPAPAHGLVLWETVLKSES